MFLFEVKIVNDWDTPIPPLPAPRRTLEDRPGWDDYFMGLAFAASQRSPDLSTQHGCVIVTENRHILGTGYNGFRPGSDDLALQVTREIKYANVIHSEVNAVDNCLVNPRFLKHLTAYVTGQVCGECAEYLARHGVLAWVMADRRGFTNHAQSDLMKFEGVVRRHGVSIRRIKPRLEWMVARHFTDDLRSHGFLES
jgi:dCMP deaminase